MSDQTNNNDKLVKEFNERFEALCDEMGVVAVVKLQYGPSSITPQIQIVPKNKEVDETTTEVPNSE